MTDDDATKIDVEPIDDQPSGEYDSREDFQQLTRESIEEASALLDGSHHELSDRDRAIAHMEVVIVDTPDGARAFSSRHLDPTLDTETAINTTRAFNRAVVGEALDVGLRNAITSSTGVTMGSLDGIPMEF